MRSKQGLTEPATAKALDEINHTLVTPPFRTCRLLRRGPLIELKQDTGAAAHTLIGGRILTDQGGEQSLLTGKTLKGNRLKQAVRRAE